MALYWWHPAILQLHKAAATFLFWNTATRQRLASLHNLSWPVCCASFNPAGTSIAVAGNTTPYLVDPSTQVIVRQVEMERVVNSAIEAIAFNSEKDLLAAAKRNAKVELWQVPDLNLPRSFFVGPPLRPAPGSAGDAPVYPQAVSAAFAHNTPCLAANNSEGKNSCVKNT
jgi:WD40 repeat protein